MNQSFFSQSYCLSFHECDMYSRIHFSCLLNRLCETAGFHLTGRGISRKDLLKNHQVFFLSSMTISLNRLPKYSETFSISTWEMGTSGPKFLRGYEISDANGNILGDAYSVWILVNPQTHKIYRPTEYKFERIPIEKEPQAQFTKAISQHGNQLTEHTFQFCEADANGHINNSVYASITINNLPANLFNKQISYFQIQFKNEATINETIFIYRNESSANQMIIWGEFQDHRKCFESIIHFTI